MEARPLGVNLGGMRDFRKLAVFPKAHALALRIYVITRKFPRDELYGMVTEMRRSGRSVPANLVEGCGKHTQKDLARYVDNSIGSANELLYYDLLARDLGYIDPETADDLARQIEEVIRMLTALARAVRTGPDLGDRPKAQPSGRSTRRIINRGPPNP